MRKSFIVALFFSFCLISYNVAAQVSNASRRAQEIAASLDKTKHKVKEKYGIRVEMYVEVKNDAVAKANPKDYSGEYESEDLGANLKIQVANDGTVQGGGTDFKGEKFTFRDARIEDGLLTATKVYENGKRENFEGVFVNRIVRAGKSPNDARITYTGFGLAVPAAEIALENGIILSNIFYEFKR